MLAWVAPAVVRGCGPGTMMVEAISTAGREVRGIVTWGPMVVLGRLSGGRWRGLTVTSGVTATLGRGG